uniref:Proteasome activator subunit 4 n=1 Tax=Kwoniella dejecticola CBS 10117 TaxID=1296121 RepID=A0A1A5ZUE4_9TREE|nr:proteasome activator subunit 4 [Kwoniella dejecticola CBS 10117]OBR81434.1 proteasome activator subunit 4 [Kwoniella dejecticola CBS 10117]
MSVPSAHHTLSRAHPYIQQPKLPYRSSPRHWPVAHIATPPIPCPPFEHDHPTSPYPSKPCSAMGFWPSAVPSCDQSDDTRLSCLGLPLSLPYEVETLAEMDDKLDLICCRMVECIKAREYGMGFRVWDSALSIWMSMGYPLKRDIKIKLIFIYYEMMFVPGLSSSFIEDASNQFINLIGDRSLNIYDFRIPWRPLYEALYFELFPHPNKLARHSVNLAPSFLNVAESAQRFFHPSDVDEMLEEILPRLEPSMDSILATQTFLVHFLPISHCQKWLPIIFRLWHGLNSGLWDDQASDLMGQLAIAHVDPGKSDPSVVNRIPKGTHNTAEEQAKNPSIRRRFRAHKTRLAEVAGEVEDDEDGVNYWAKESVLPPEEILSDPSWAGIRKDVGIFSDQEFEFLMSKCLRSLNVPVGGSIASQNSMSVTMADARASKKILDAKKPIDRVQSLAETIVFSMSEDSPFVALPSGTATPDTATPLPNSARNATPIQPAISRLQNGSSMARSASSDSLAVAGQKSEIDRRYLAGSKALDHLSKLLTSCETFFHPSNSGHWSVFLTTFLSHLASNFVERWKSEEEPDCRTPAAWRLTPAIKREFVLCLRPLALTSMFNKAMTPAISALKKLSLLEPDLIMPAMMERAVPSLQGLEETQRTPAVTYALAALSQPLTARQIWRFGGMYVADIFALFLPGIDLNDPAKTGLSCMAISNMVDFIHMADIAVDDQDDTAPGPRAIRSTPRPTVADDPNDPVQHEMEDLRPEEVDGRVRFATSAFRDWVPEFLGRVLLLFSNLPEEGGKSGRAGGKTEALTLSSVLHTCGGVFAALDDKLFDAALDQVVEYATTTCRANAVDAVGELVRNLASANATKVFSKLFPICRQRIIHELKTGASSLRTTTTSIPLPADAGLHWWQSILIGMLIPGRVILSDKEIRAQYIELLKIMIDSALSERGWQWTGKIIEKSVSSLTSIYFRDMRALNDDVYQSQDFKRNHTLYWGKLYRSAEVKPDWRVPTTEDIDMALDIIGIADQATTKLNNLLENPSFGDKVWSNEFCRSINVVDKILRGTYNLIAEIESRKTGGVKAPSFLPEEILTLLPPYKSGLILTNPEDPRYQHVAAFRTRVGDTLHRAAAVMRTAGQSDNSVETVKLLVTTIGTYLTAYGVRSKQFAGAQNAYTGMMATKKMYESQRKHHRTIFLAAASVHHQNRLTTLAYYRNRSELDDKLIVNLLNFCLSPFVRVRRSSQSTLDTVAKLYRGTWVLCFPTLFDALQPGTDPDIMKGALYVLRYNHMGLHRIAKDWRQLLQLTECLLGAHHENKASVQALVSKATDELIQRIKEPVSFDMDIRTEKIHAAADDLASVIDRKPSKEIIEKIHQGTKDRLKQQDAEWDIFVDRVLAIANAPGLNWRYVLSASRFLLTVMRRDKPTDLRLAKFFMGNVQNPHPRIRDYGTVGITRLLFHIALRSLCQGSDELLFLEEPVDIFSKDIDLTDTSPEFTQKYLASFKDPLPQDESQALLQDRQETGWLAWGKKIEVSRLSGWDEISWTCEAPSQEGSNLIQSMMVEEGWWQKIADHWAQESERNYPSATHIDFILALTQLYGPPIYHAIKPIVENYLAEMENTKVYDRHKTRAMWEFLAGLVRGSMEWSGKDRKEFWAWFGGRLGELFGNIRHDTIKCWDISIEYILCDQDPRRYKPLVDFCINTALNADFQGGSAFDLARRVQLVRSVIRCLQWRFNAWADDFAELYFKSIACPYAEVRGLMASVLNAVDQIKFYPSYPSAAALIADILSDPNDEKDLMRIRSGLFMPQLQDIMTSLPEWKKDRPHGPKAVLSTHDTSASTALSWLSVELSDVHAVATFPYIISVLPAIFELRDLNDNADLQRTAGRLLAVITSITPALDLIEPLMASLISILQDSTSWRTKMHSMPVLSLVYFRNLSLLSEPCKAKCLDVVSACLRDPNQEVREMASATLSGFLRCSQRTMVVVLKDRFTREIKSTVLPKRRDAPGQINPEYQAKLVQLHGAVLGATALVEAFPYTVPKFIPKLLADVLAPRSSDPAPISTTIRSCVASFKRTHEKYQDKFTEDELSAMNYAQAGNSYCKSARYTTLQKLFTGLIPLPSHHRCVNLTTEDG